MEYKLSIICPAIRVDRWVNMYKSIEKSFSGSWELILVTEMNLPEELKNKDNIKVIFSERSPMAKQQQGLEHCEGEYITIVSDDSLWLEGTLDETFDNINTLIEQNKFDYKTIIVLKYLEGKEFSFPDWYKEQVRPEMRFDTNYDFMRANKYYWSDTHESSNIIGIPYHSPILSCAIYTRKLLLEVGGWDSQFQSQAMGNIDLSARLMYHGCNYVIQDIVVSTCGYMEEATGDHGRIHYCQLYDDQPLLNDMYKIERRDRIFMSLDNWKNSDDIWKFKNPDVLQYYKDKEKK